MKNLVTFALIIITFISAFAFAGEINSRTTPVLYPNTYTPTFPIHTEHTYSSAPSIHTEHTYTPIPSIHTDYTHSSNDNTYTDIPTTIQSMPTSPDIPSPSAFSPSHYNSSGKSVIFDSAFGSMSMVVLTISFTLAYLTMLL
ncbi:hypothetical protein Glove_184g46 [Diversispora epigaea]|uniref:Uncharacterized protein n=1 Tax=Diversispora epigaea TaxID=1348612 RepID=A0A397IX67_9GLOM|nr:hypothetical protein Glove_184g46 [Diversispora epigaea]